MKLRIRDLRKNRNLNQRKIAEYLRCDQSLYSKYEREIRVVPLHILVKLALFYHTSIDYLVGLTNEAKPYKRST